MAAADPLDELAALAEALGHRFADPSLLAEALTHPSAIKPGGRKVRARDYDRLEFLGDRVLGLVVADLLHSRFPTADAGELARRFNGLVRQESLARVADTVGLGDFVKLSKSERESGGAAKPAILADACEAVIAALYLDGGLPAAEAFIRGRFEPLLQDLASDAKDPKTALQEWAAARNLEPPVYAVAAQAGPAHEPMFTVTVSLADTAGLQSAEGRGGSKRAAEQAAARALLKTLPADRRRRSKRDSRK